LPTGKTLAAFGVTLYVGSMATSAYLIYGGDEYRVSAKAKEIIEKLLTPEEQAFGLETIDGAVDNSAAGFSAARKLYGSVTSTSSATLRQARLTRSRHGLRTCQP